MSDSNIFYPDQAVVEILSQKKGVMVSEIEVQAKYDTARGNFTAAPTCKQVLKRLCEELVAICAVTTTGESEYCLSDDFYNPQALDASLLDK